MFRYRVEPPTPPLDEATAERLLDGAPLDDLPDAYRPLGKLLAAASGPRLPHEVEGATSAAAAFVAAHAAAHPSRKRRRVLVALAVTAFVLVSSTGTALAATQGVLPDPVQDVAHEALGAVGISVPGTHDGGTGPDRPAVSGSPTGATGTPSTGTETGGQTGGSGAPGAGAAAVVAPSTPAGAVTPAPGAGDPAATPPAADQPSTPSNGSGRAGPGDPSPAGGGASEDKLPPGQQKKATDGETSTPPGQGGVPPGQAKKDG